MKKIQRIQKNLQVIRLELALQSAHQQISSLQNQLAESKWLEESLRTRTKDMNERSKELQCIYSICRALANEQNLAELSTKICTLLPKGFQFPLATWVKVEVCGQQFCSRGFQLSEYSLACDIRLRGKMAGKISIYVRPVFDQYHKTPVLQAESILLETVAILIGNMLENHANLSTKN